MSQYFKKTKQNIVSSLSCCFWAGSLVCKQLSTSSRVVVKRDFTLQAEANTLQKAQLLFWKESSAFLLCVIGFTVSWSLSELVGKCLQTGHFQHKLWVMTAKGNHEEVFGFCTSLWPISPRGCEQPEENIYGINFFFFFLSLCHVVSSHITAKPE